MQRWQCKVCLGSASPLPPGVTARQRPQAFRELVSDPYGHSFSLQGLCRILDLRGCGVGTANLWRDVQVVAGGGRNLAVDQWRKAPRSCGPGTEGERLDLSGSGFDGGDWITVLAQRGAQGVTTDDDPLYGPALDASGLGWQQCAMNRHIRGLNEEALTHLDRVLLQLWQALAQGRVCLAPEVRQLSWHLIVRWHELVHSQHNPRVPATTNRLEGRSGHFKLCARLTRRMKTEAGAHHFMGLMALGMA